MTVIREMAFPGHFTNYFLARLDDDAKQHTPDPTGPDAKAFVKTLWHPALELTHNHGTETDDSFQVHTGNSDPQGFGHIGFIVDDLDAMCQELEAVGVPFAKRPKEGKMSGLAFVLDPNGYKVELVQRAMTIPAELLQPAS